MIRDRVLRRDNAAWERIGGGSDETPSEIYGRRRKLMIDAERRRVVEIRDTGKIAHEVVDEVLAMLDVEESMLDYSADERERVRASGVPAALEGGCEHLQQVRRPVEPDTPGECGDCLPRGHGVGAPADVRRLRPHRLLRLLAPAPRERALRARGPRGDALGGVRRGLALVLRRRADRVSRRTG